jgi:hypothetical protein
MPACLLFPEPKHHSRNSILLSLFFFGVSIYLFIYLSVYLIIYLSSSLDNWGLGRRWILCQVQVQCPPKISGRGGGAAILANRSLPLAKQLPPVSADVTFLTKATAFPARSLGGQGAQARFLRARELILPASCLLRLWSLSNEVSRGGGSRAGGSDKDETK